MSRDEMRKYIETEIDDCEIDAKFYAENDFEKYKSRMAFNLSEAYNSLLEWYGVDKSLLDTYLIFKLYQ